MAPQQNRIKLAAYLILHNFGDNVSKVAERLLQHGPLTVNQIVQRTPHPRKVVKNSLLVLIQHNCVQSFSRELKVNKEILWAYVLDEMHHAALNLKLRLSDEFEQEKELLGLPINKMSGARFDRRRRLENIRLLLESSLLNLDDAIMLFHDF